MAEQPRTRQELYEQIRESSKDEFILSEMVRLGFWEEDENKPSISKDIIEKKGAIQRELRGLLKEDRKLDNPEQWLKEYRQQRLKESREKQEANRQKRAEEKKQKAKAWKERKEKEILYLGEDISNKLHHKNSNKEQLNHFGLPDFKDALALAKAMKLELSKLRFLAFNRKVSTVSHYKRFYMQKKSGGQRLISAPMPLLKTAQYWILENILNIVPTHESAHGFKAEHSIVSNARPHIGQDLVVNFDFKDFFPTISFNRVRGTFENLGYSPHIATILAAICTEAPTDEVEMDGKTYFVAAGERHLPQGAPTSPALTNIICYKLDKRMVGMAKSLGFTYTRYADDMSFSASGEATENIRKLFWRVEAISTDEGFVLHPDKKQIMRKGRRQEVTGIVVNEQLGINRHNLKKFRALLFQIERDGIEGKKWGTSPNLVEAIRGYANFVAMVKPEQGKVLQQRIENIFQEKIIQSEKSRPKNTTEFSKKVATQQKETKNKFDEKSPDKGELPKWKLW